MNMLWYYYAYGMPAEKLHIIRGFSRHWHALQRDVLYAVMKR